MELYSSDPDDDLVAAARASLPGAADAIYKRYCDPIFTYIFFRVHDSDVAQDLLQDVFCRFFLSGLRKIALDGRGLKPYLYGIARNRVSDHFREINGNITMPLSLHTTASDEPPLESSFDNHYIEKALSHLPDEKRECIELRYAFDMSTTEIAELLGVSDRTVRRHLNSACTILEPILRERKGEEFTHGRE